MRACVGECVASVRVGVHACWCVVLGCVSGWAWCRSVGVWGGGGVGGERFGRWGRFIVFFLCREKCASAVGQTPKCFHLPLAGIIMCRVGQNHIYTVYIRYIWQGNHQIYGHIRCIYTVLANPNYVTFCDVTCD